jgi:beta-mannosidase
MKVSLVARFSFAALSLAVLFGVAHPAVAQSAVEHYSLNGTWQFRETATDPIAADAVGTHAGTTDWHPATVPGAVQTDLLANGMIPHPFYRDDEAKLQWIGLANWEYQKTFALTPALMRRQHAELVFRGLDTFAEVFVNGTHVLSADNMFRTWRVDVKPQLHAGQNTVRIEFTSPILKVLPQIEKLKYPLPAMAITPWSKQFGVFTSNYVRKAPYNYGWDWGPRFVTIGVWRPAEIEFWDAARIDNIYVRQMDVRAAAANLSVDATVVAGGSTPATAVLEYGRKTAHGRAAMTALRRSVALHSGENHIVFPLNIAHPALWFPLGYGAQSLYTFHVKLLTGARAADTADAETGLRHVELVRKDDRWGRSFYFSVNGIPIFAKGANLIPFDSFPDRVTDAQMAHILDSARDAHMNMLRVWGGGYYETNRFYQMADERGILLWQEFMFSDAMYPHNPAFLRNVRQEAIDQVRRLRNHPSIVLWCGNNEIESGWHSWGNFEKAVAAMPPDRRDEEWGGYMRLFSGILPNVVARYAPGAAYWPSSPSNNFSAATGNDQYGDAHYWAVWHGRAPFSTYADQYPRFMSEYGFQSFPSMATIDEFTQPDDRTLLSKVMLAHQKNSEGNQLIKIYMQGEFPEPKDFAAFVYVSQVLQAEGIKLGAEHLRRNRPHVMGSLYWQLNDCWPVASWSSIDYYGRWKALQYYARRFYQDELVSPYVRAGRIEVSVISDRTTPLRGKVRVELMDFQGKVLAHKDIPVTLQPLSAKQVWTEDQSDFLAGADPATVFLHTELVIRGENGGHPVSDNNLYFLPYKDLHLPAATVHAHWTTIGGHPAVVLTSATLARDVYLQGAPVDNRPSDNFFDLLPNQPRTITFAHGDTASLTAAIHIHSLTDAFNPDGVPASAATTKNGSL